MISLHNHTYIINNNISYMNITKKIPSKKKNFYFAIKKLFYYYDENIFIKN